MARGEGVKVACGEGGRVLRGEGVGHDPLQMSNLDCSLLVSCEVLLRISRS